MFNVGGGELLVIMLIALIVLGPNRLPDAARQVGKVMGDLRRLSSGFQNEMKTAFTEADDPTRVAARRNVLAKEAPATPMADRDGAVAAAVAAVSKRPEAAAKKSPPARAKTTSATKKAAPAKKKAAPAKKAAPVKKATSTAKQAVPAKKKAAPAKKASVSKPARPRRPS